MSELVNIQISSSGCYFVDKMKFLAGLVDYIPYT
jgi:hypothetical protein